MILPSFLRFLCFHARSNETPVEIEKTISTQLISFESDEHYSVVAKSVDEARKLLGKGLEYVCQKDDLMLFRKRK